MEHERESYGGTNCKWFTWNDLRKLGMEANIIRNRGMIWDHPNYSTAEVDQNTKKNSVDLRRLAITQTSVKDHQLTLIWQIRKE